MEFDFDQPTDETKLKSILSDEILNENTDPKNLTKDIVKFLIKSSKDRLIGGTIHDTKFILDNAKQKAEDILLETPNVNVWIDVEKNGTISETYIFEGLSWSIMQNPSNTIQGGHRTQLDEELNYTIEHEYILDKFLNHCKNYLKLEELPSIRLMYNREGPMTTGVYNPKERTIGALAGSRAFVDALRTLAHELVHFKQDIEGRLVGDIPVVGGQIEDEANAVAGQLVKSFGLQQDNDIIYDL